MFNYNTELKNDTLMQFGKITRQPITLNPLIEFEGMPWFFPKIGCSNTWHLIKFSVVFLDVSWLCVIS